MTSPSPCDASRSTLLVIDLQQRLMPAIHERDAVLRNARILAQAARWLHVPVAATVQNPAGLGPKVDEIAPLCDTVVTKTAFDACAEPALLQSLDPAHELIVAGCEAHVCVMQTVLGLLSRGWKVKVVADAIGSRAPASKAAALERLCAAGAEVVTAEMVVFEWLRDCTHPRFKDCLMLIK
jgi:nicotinamidase-related amidase